MFELERNTILTSAKLSIAWRFSMLMSILTGPLFLLINLMVWRAVFSASGRELIGGLTPTQMVMYLAVANLTLYLVWDDAEYHIANRVRDGNFTTYLLRPVTYLWYAFLWKIGHRSIAFAIEFIPILIVVSFIVGPATLLQGHWGYFAAMIAIAFVINYLIKTILGLLSFWVIRMHGLIALYRGINPLLYGTFFPLSILPMPLQYGLLFLPFQFVSYVPARAFTGEYQLASISLTPLQVFAAGIVHILVLLGIAGLLWRAAIKRFQGVGT